MSGAIEARIEIENLNIEKQELKNLTKGFKSGIYNGPVFKRRFAENKEYGVPFLTSATMLRADLSTIPYLVKSDAYSKKLSYLELKTGMTMISCSGAIGNMVYVRKDMQGYWSCQDQLKVVPDETKILSGYLYAFLNSKFGLPLITSGTYGAIFQHIEPVHIEDMKIPLVDNDVQIGIHNMIEKVAVLRTASIELLKNSSKAIEANMNFSYELENKTELSVNIISSKKIIKSRRMDVRYFSPDEEKVSDILEKQDYKFLDDIADVVKPGMFKRIMSTKENDGIAFHTGSELFQMDIRPKYYVSRRTQHIDQCILKPYWILLQAFGQRGGLIGRVMMVTNSLANTSATDLQIQIKAKNRYDAGYIFAYLNSVPGYISIIRTPIGGSIPHINPDDIKKLKIYWPDLNKRKEIGKNIIDAWDMRDKASNMEREAINMLENHIDSMANKH